MPLSRFALALFGALPVSVAAADAPLRFDKIVLNDQYLADGIGAGDFNRDGHMDVVCGPYWYEGPTFAKRHEFYPMAPQELEKHPTDSLFSFVHDFNGDGWSDILVCGRVKHHEAFWYENPRGQSGLWKKHFVTHRVLGESPELVAPYQDGRVGILSHWEGRWGWWMPEPSDPTKPWSFHGVTEQETWAEYYHGSGLGDLNGDGRLDLVLNDGWWEQPAERGQPWIAHRFRFGARGGAHILVYDVNGDGKNDVITALDAHRWGLSWFEQIGGADGNVTFREHRIMGDRSEEALFGVAFSQPHALALADLDGDGLMDIVTGKRRWAHGPTGDVEPMGTPVNYWFRLQRDPEKGARYTPVLIDDASGLGTQLTVADVNSDGLPDVLTASKLGAFVFLARRP